MEDIYDRCQVLTLDAENLHADEHAVEIVENYMDEDIDLILAVGSGTIHDISRYLGHFQYKVPFVSVPTAASVDGFVSNVAAMTWERAEKNSSGCRSGGQSFADTDIFACAPKRADGFRRFGSFWEVILSHRLEDRPSAYWRIYL